MSRLVATKVAKHLGTKAMKKVGQSTIAQRAGIGGATVAVAEVLEDNPYVSAAEGALLGAAVAGPVGAVAGGLVGWFMADGERIAPCDLVAIPAYEMALLRQGMAPSFQLFIKEGELIAPILPTAAMENTAALEDINQVAAAAQKPKRKTGLPKKYAKMGFKKGWREYKKTPAWKKKQAAKKKKGGKR